MLGNFNFTILAIKHKGINKDYEFWGSYYRGMLGRNLKKRFCILKDVSCEECPLTDKCLYMISFEKYKDTLFLPYVINRATNNYLQLTILGIFTKFSMMYLEAFRKDLKVEEMGYLDILQSSIKEHEIIYNSKQFCNVQKQFNNAHIKIRFGRFKKNSQMIPCENLSFLDIVKSIERRLYLINKHFGDPEEKIYIDFQNNADLLNCEQFVVKRYSNRKAKTMNIPTLNVDFSLDNIQDLYKYLLLASYLNIGTNASMGFGQVYVH